MFVSNVLAKSTNLTSSPVEGAAGKVIVKAPPVVSTKILSPLKAVYVVVLVTHVPPDVWSSYQLVPSVARKTLV